MRRLFATFVMAAISMPALAGWGRPSESELPPLDYLVEGYTATPRDGGMPAWVGSPSPPG